MKTIEVTRAVYADRCNVEHLVTFRFSIGSDGDTEYISASPNVFEPMEGMTWIQGREYIAELDYQLTQAHMIALEQMEAANES